MGLKDPGPGALRLKADGPQGPWPRGSSLMIWTCNIDLYLTVLENLMMVPGDQSGENLINALLKPKLNATFKIKFVLFNEVSSIF